VPAKVFQKFETVNVTWSVTVSQEGRLSVCEDSAEENEYTKRYEVRGEWRKLHNEELNDLQPSPNIIEMMKWTR
jgi:hypothetical protein